MTTKPTLKLVRAEVDRFLSGIDPEVLCISGKWGVGKTYSWNQFLLDAKKDKKISLGHYSYVSLFGVKNLNDLKYSLFEAKIPVDRIGEKFEWGDLKKSFISTVESPLYKIAGYFSRISGIENVIGATESILFSSVRNQLVCIDDLERAGSGLDVLDVFGLISFLKEQRKCKIVLLLNKEEIEGSQRVVFDKQFEKIVDTHFQFEPTPEEAAEIVFPSPEGIRKDLRDHCVTLGIVNIRVIKKIEKICVRLENILKDKYSHLIHQAIHSATLFAWSKYQKDNVPPPFDFLKDVSRLHGLFRDKEKSSEDDRKWKELMAEYKFANVDDFDLAIHVIVESGLPDQEVLLEAAEKQSQGVTKAKQEQLIHDTWDLYHGSFDDNEKEVMDKIFNVSLANLKVISPSNLNATVRTLKEFGRKENAAELIKKYIEERPNEKNLYDLKGSAFGSDVQDPDVLQAFEKKLTGFVDNRNPADVLEAMVRNRGWNLEDVELLDKLNTGDFYKIFKSERGDRLHIVIKGALQLKSKESTESKEHGSIAERAIKALEEIAHETRLNAKRVAAQGVRLPEDVPDQQSPAETSPRTL